MFKKVRIAVLGYVLFLVAGGAWMTLARSTDWDEPLWVLIYPINADGSAAAARYIAELGPHSVASIEAFFAERAAAHGVQLERPFAVNLAQPVTTLPPEPPPRDGERPNTLSVIWWSLELRYWALQVQRLQSEPAANIQLFVLYHDPDARKTVPHSLGLQKGLIGVVHAFASEEMTESNNVIIAHEMLHTVGASDKYDPATGLPQHPHGYAEPNREPRFPQTHAELMGGRVPIDPTHAETPPSLRFVTIGSETAAEIGWLTSG